MPETPDATSLSEVPAGAVPTLISVVTLRVVPEAINEVYWSNFELSVCPTGSSPTVGRGDGDQIDGRRGIEID